MVALSFARFDDIGFSANCNSNLTSYSLPLLRPNGMLSQMRSWAK